MPMRPVEVFIIYLAVGSPFAMTYFLRNRRKSVVKLAMLTVATLLCWLPVLLFRIARSFALRDHLRQPDLETETSAKMELRLKEIFALAGLTGPGRNLRESLERYAALTTAVKRPTPAPDSLKFELFSISGNRNETTGSSCLARQNMKKLLLHQEKAADDLVNSLTLITLKSNAMERLSDMITLFAKDLDDQITADKIRYVVTLPEIISVSAKPRATQPV